jgi:nucleoside phosphorylase
MTIGVVAGLTRELRCLGPPSGFEVFAAAGSGQRAYRRAKHWIAGGRLRGLVSFGLCGGLDPSLGAGALVIAHEIHLAGGEVMRFDDGWATLIAERLPEARVAPLLGAAEPATSAAEKHALFLRHGVAALDMESGGVAAAAREADIPFVAVRAVADPADRRVPAAALAGMDEHGRMRPLRVLRGLLARPGDLFTLIALAREAQCGYTALAAVARSGALAAELVPGARALR